ncbi:MAG: CPBP family intramembrane metalloprotease [Planctomycetes bacterium]|nr:CPBP family intramembrane metalloprotease [Planctomycetota bacterium]
MVSLIAVLIGLRAVRTDLSGTRRSVALWSALVGGLALAPVPDGARLVLALACLPLARAQAGALWWLLANARAMEGVAAPLAPDRELVHKLLWALLFAADQALVLGAGAIAAWRSTPIGFLVFVGPVLILTTACLAERGLGSGLRPRASGWTWLGVQAAAAWEEILFRGLVCSLLWPLLSGDVALVVILGATLFALPHFERGMPNGPRGVAVTFALGAASILLGLPTGSLLPGFLLHGVLLGSYGVLRWRRQRARACGSLARDAALFLVRLRHGYYVTDWEGERIRRLAGLDDPLAARIRERIAGAGDLVAVAHSELGEPAYRGEERGPSGLAWLRRWGAFLIVAMPEGVLPPQRFPSISLRIICLVQTHRARARNAPPVAVEIRHRQSVRPLGDVREAGGQDVLGHLS